MSKAFIGIYYKTSDQAVEAFEKMPEWKRNNHSIVEFQGAYMIVSNEQIKALEVKTIK